MVSAAPLDVGHGKLCLAVDPADSQSLWWWESGDSGCSSRSTGPGVFHEDAIVKASAATIDVQFRLQQHGQPSFADVHITIQGGDMRVTATGAQVTTLRWNNLDVPERPAR